MVIGPVTLSGDEKRVSLDINITTRSRGSQVLMSGMNTKIGPVDGHMTL